MLELIELMNRQKMEWYSRILYIRNHLRRGVWPWNV